VATVQGIAQLIARPTYAGMVSAEPYLRRLILPLVIVLFIAVAIAAIVVNMRAWEAAEAEIRRDLSLTADLAAARLQLAIANGGERDIAVVVQSALDTDVEASRREGAHLLVTGPTDRVI